MTEGLVSKEEMDALLAQNSGGAGAPQGQANELTAEERDAIGEIGNISLGSAATALSTLLNRKVGITTPTVKMTSLEAVITNNPQFFVTVEVQYTKGLSGMNIFVLKPQDAAIIGDLMMGGDGRNVGEEMSELQLSAVGEAMNQMMGSMATAIASMMNKRIDISPPITRLLDFSKDKEELLKLGTGEKLIMVSFHLSVQNIVESEFFQLIPAKFSKDMVNALYETATTMPGEVEMAATAAAMPAAPKEAPAPSAPRGGAIPAFAQPAGPKVAGAAGQAVPQHSGEVFVQPAQFASFAPLDIPVQTQNLNLLLDVALGVTVELGRTKMMIKDILELGKGSIVELEKLAGEPIDILVNGKLIAKGEVVVIDENFAVKITDIVSPMERVNNLQ